MALHPSLRRSGKLSGSRSVMTRTERIKWLIAKGLFNQESRVLGLPKIKVIKLKAVKKEKVKEEAPAATPEQQAPAVEKKPAE